MIVAAAAGLAQGAQSSVEMDAAGNVKAIVAGARRLTPPAPYSYFQLDNEAAGVKHTSGGAYQLTAASASGILRVSSGNGPLFHFEQAIGSKAKTLSLDLTWPANVQLHLAGYLNLGRMLDHNIPLGEVYKGTLRYNFFVVHSEGAWVRFRAEEKRLQSKTSILVARHPRCSP